MDASTGRIWERPSMSEQAQVTTGTSVHQRTMKIKRPWEWTLVRQANKSSRNTQKL